MEIPVTFSGENNYTALINHYSLDLEDEQQFLDHLNFINLTVDSYNQLTPEEAITIAERYYMGDENTDYRDLAESLFDDQVGIQKLVWIQSEEVCSEALTDILGTCDDKKIEKIFGFPPNGACTSEIISEVTCSFHGQFLAEVHTPVFRRSKGGGTMFSWGYTRMHVILASDLKEITKKALAWAKQEQEEMERKLDESKGI